MDPSNPTYIWLVVLLPLLAFAVLAITGPSLQKSLGKRAVGIIGVVPIALAFLLGALITQNYVSGGWSAPVSRLGTWIDLPGLTIPFEFVVDPLSLTMVLIVTGIGALIHLYSTGYMAEEREYSRFFAYLNLFIVSMLILVLANNLPLLFVGWEGVGLCSYLLIGFWYQDVANARAANKAFIVNRIGDWSLMLAMFLIVGVLTTYAGQIADTRLLSFDVALPALRDILGANPGLATAIALLLFGGAAGKSAQFPLYNWLPDAMAGPTPVSALIHAATMVTSGVVLLNRFNVVFQMSPVASAIVCAIGAFTALFAALIAFGQTDIKKVLAYSTVSQLGFMFIGVGAGAYWSGMFHVTTHAFFKALLFLGAGSVIHAMAHNQDMRNYGNLRKYLPITCGAMVIGALAIAGFPMMSGFYSKEAILGAALANNHAAIGAYQVGQWAGWVGLFVAALTAIYMMRLTLLTFGGTEERWRAIPAAHHDHDDADHHDLDAHHTPHESPPSMTIPLVILALLSLGGGFVLSSGGAFEHWLYPHGLAVLPEVHHEYPNLMALSIGAAGIGLILGAILYWRGLPKNQGFNESAWSPLRQAQRDQFGYDSLTHNLFVVGGGELAREIDHSVEHGVIGVVVDGSGTGVLRLGGVLRRLQNGAARVYAVLMLTGGVVMVAWVLILLARGGGN